MPRPTKNPPTAQRQTGERLLDPIRDVVESLVPDFLEDALLDPDVRESLVDLGEVLLVEKAPEARLLPARLRRAAIKRGLACLIDDVLRVPATVARRAAPTTGAKRRPAPRGLGGVPLAVGLADLRPADVLMVRGTTTLARLIRQFDGGSYSHAALWDGTQIIEAVKQGVIARPMAISLRRLDVVDVFRYAPLPGMEGPPPGVLEMAVGEQARHWAAQGERYAYEQIVLLAVLSLLRRGELPPQHRRLVRSVADRAAARLAELAAAGRQPMICSELVYRCFAHAEPAGQWTLALAHTEAPAEEEPPAPEEAEAKSSAPAPNMEAARDRLLNALARVRPATDPRVEPDFVTPADLEHSPSLQRLGRLKLV